MNKVLTPAGLHRIAHPNYAIAPHQLLLQREFVQCVTTPQGRLIVQMPPQHTKSHWMSIVCPAWLLLSDPTKKILILSYEAGLAQINSEACRDIVKQYGPQLTGVHTKSDAEARHRWLTTRGGYMQATSMLGSVTGRPADLVIVDDPFKGDEDASSPTVREKVHRAFMSVARTRLSPTGQIIIVNTRWGPDDLCGRILANSAEGWKVLSLPALCTDPVNDALNRQLGDPLWPARYPLKWYLDTKREYEQNALSYMWECLYQCNAVSDGSQGRMPEHYFPPEILYDEVPASEEVVVTVMAVDPSLGKTVKSDYSAIVTTRLTKSRHIYCDCDIERRPLPKLEEDVVRIYGDVRPLALALEANGFQQVFCDNVKRRLQGIHLNPNVHALTQTYGGGSSKLRIKQSLAPLLEQGRLHIRKSPGGRLLLAQLKEHPHGANDDGPDALELSTQLLNLMLTGKRKPTPTRLTT